MQFTISPYMARALRETLDDHNDGEEVMLTVQPASGSADPINELVVAFSLATVTIDADGNAEDN